MTLAPYTDVATYATHTAPGTVLIRRGQTATHALHVLSGRVTLGVVEQGHMRHQLSVVEGPCWLETPASLMNLPHVVDAEHMGPCKKGPTVKDITAELEVFLDEVERHYGKRPIIYTTSEFHDAYLARLFPKERFWIRSIFVAPSFRQDQWIFWQYHNKAARQGVTGPIDLNAFRGTQAEFDALMK